MDYGRVSVRKIVEFVLRRGDIDSRHTSNHTALEGARIHRKLQKAAGEAYQKEVSLKRQFTLENEDTLTIEGRADGIFTKDEQVVIDEIKTSEVYFENLPESQVELFYFQGMVYAYLYALEEDISEIGVQLTYYQTTEELITRNQRQFTMEELTAFMNHLLEEYHKWLVFQGDWRRVRNTSLTKLTFPYEEFRKGQRELAAAAYKTLKTSRRLFVEAPTGTGKTISTLFPALKAMGEESADRLFYLTAKTITRQVAEDALAALGKTGGEVKSVTLTAKDKICFLTERNCTPEHCPYAAGYYDRINEGLWDLLHHENQITRSVIEAYSEKHQLCPFEFSLDVSLFCDVIVGDYNYLFDPTVYLRRFFEDPKEDYFFLVDEAHNLVSRSREMYSATLNQRTGATFEQQLGKEHKALRRLLRKIDNHFALLEEQAQTEKWQFKHQKLLPEALINQLYRFAEKMKEWLAANPSDPGEATGLSYYFEVLHFLKISELYDDHFETTIEVGYQGTKIKLFCIAPAPFLEGMLEKGKGALLFSASFSPLDYYQDVLGGGGEALRYKLPSPFPPTRQKIILANYIQTTYQQRQSSLPEVVNAVYEMVKAKQGNYLVFFPSYQYLDEVVALFHDLHPEVTTLIQDTQMNETEREQFLARFKENPQATLLGFCVLGGIFSEGIDLKGSRLIGTAVVGVGLPQMNHEQELIKEYFQETRKQGFEYAYQLPGMNKVLQAAGRVIRDATDYGVVLLLDQRFNTPRYRKLFPAHWQHARIAYNPQRLQTELQTFWQQQKAAD
ncbi:helicase [Enterococcus asini ATCC 700915]|uniref:DNA 5'-3' helicase n=1 Tax=Enterococcus asini ATCC 700915 TaxID=1158606 RepID=R2S2U5_9ENTE|nr:ATP-dependent DNA helicase [Enterococcus asini]EOH87176.1 helicase [Enterococcus asini ATCC 700915]EOT58418.1 helicase [Enterococcus asini ATCC 700915]